jgi:DNA-directed RNA polymerase specialized sigma24 family protein
LEAFSCGGWTGVWEAFPRQFPAFPRHFPRFPRHFPGFPRQFPAFPRQFLGFPRQFLGFPRAWEAFPRHFPSLPVYLPRVRPPAYCAALGDVDEPTLLRGFREEDAALTSLFFALLIPALRARIRKRWKSLRHVHDEMEGQCLQTLAEWSAAGSLRDGESIDELVSRLVRASAVVFQRAEEKDERISTATAALPRDATMTAEEAVISEELRQRVWDLQTTLEAKHQWVLESVAEAELGKRTLAEILKVSPEAAWKMAERARAALYAAIRKEGLTAADFLDVPEASDG